ncbi:hypothetical protein Q3G72_023876 [Acer saccharum]|nr:hypothetical protein Q3G72_023876 [Acer saccharum]
MTMNSLKDALREKKPTVYNLVGFPFAFQVWAFEAMPSIGTLGPKFATKDGCALPRINSWWSTGAPDHKKLQEFFESKDLRVDTFLELTQEEKQQNYLLHFISPASCEVPQTNIQEDKPQDDRADTATVTQSKRLINESYHEVVTVANKGKSPVEAALVEEPRLLPKKCTMQHLAQRNMCQYREVPMSPSQDQGHSSHEHIQSSSLARDSNRSSPIATPTAKTCLHPSFSDPSEPSWPSSQFYGHNSNFHADLKTEIPSPTSIDQHVSVSFPDKVKVFCFYSHLALFFQFLTPFLVQGNDGSPSSSLDDEEAFFTELNSILDKSPNELLDSSSQIILGTSQDINQAKHLLRHCLSTDFESLVDSSQRDKVNSSLELLMKVEHVERADKSNKEVMVLREELANNRCQYFQIMGDIRLATNEMKELTNEMEELTKKMEELTKMFAEKEKYKMDLEVKAKDLVEFTKTSKNTFDQSLVKLKNWEMEKESAEEHMADIESQWDEFKRKLAKFL